MINGTAIFFNLDSSITIIENIVDFSATEDNDSKLVPENGELVFLKNDIDWDYGY